MTTEPQVTHPPVTHPETITPATAATPPEGTAKPAPRHAASRSTRPGWRMPPPKVIAAVVLVAVALELLLWQVAGVFWGLIAHAILAVVALVAVVFMVRRLRAQQRAALSAVRTLRKAGAALGQASGRSASGPLGRLLRRSGRTAGTTGGKRGGLLGGRSGGAGRGLFGRRSGGSGSSRGGLLGKLTGGRRSTGSAGRGSSGSGRGGSLLGRLGRKSASRPTASGRPAAGRAGSGAGKAQAAGPLGRLRAAAQRSQARRQASEHRPGIGRGRWGVRLGQRASAGTVRPDWRKASKRASGAMAGFLRGVREGAKPKPPRPERTPPPVPKHAIGETAAHKPTAESEKLQQPTKEQLVKEAVQRAADATPAPVNSRRSKGTAMGSMRDILAAAEDLASQMKAYDEEDMHVFVRELPQLGEALGAIEGGIKMMASRAESEWPLAAPAVEALGSVAGDIRAASNTVGEAKTTVHRENETDIERGEAPRTGERRWNV